ncbi:MAG TPA: glycerol-3-phosphate 1-O-acyltransferase PlsY [Thermohalobaculum sp.]|nr:glycerol-3-phosphate 1-O-acyltransferase PlsY [Thermohalobaculum sp.]
MFHHIMGFERALPWLLIALAVGYLAGSIPFGVLVARIFKLGDLRKIGSGSIGATNVLRTGNKLAAFTTMLLDALKGTLPVLFFLGLWGDLAGQAAGLGAFLGHCFPVWLRFNGGKGVATWLGIMLAIHPLTWAALCLTWLATAAFTRISSAGGLVAAASGPLWLILFGRWEAVLLAIILGALVWIRHHANIWRILRGKEPKIGKKSP